MALSWKKVVAGTLVMSTVLVTTLIPISSSADETVIKLNKEDVGEIVLEYSPAIKQLAKAETDLAKQHQDLNSAMSGIKALQDGLDGYKVLYNIEAAMTDNARTYFGLLLAGDGATAATMIDEVAGPTLTLGEETALKAEINALAAGGFTVAEYGQFQGLKAAYEAAGITDPNLNSSEEYEKFVAPLNGLYSMQTALMNLGITKETTEMAIANGAKSLFDAVLMLEDFQALQQLSYDMAFNDRQAAVYNYNSGKISLTDYLIIQNKLEIAKRNLDKMNRDVENMVMSLNAMLGQDITAKLELEREEWSPKSIASLEYYIEKGLKERNELETFNNSKQEKLNEYENVKEYFSKSSNTYKIIELEVAQLDIEESILKATIEENIRLAYMNFLEKKENLSVKEGSMNQAKAQYAELKVNAEVGFVTESMTVGLQVLVTQTTNDYYSALRDYESAYNALIGASSFGPAYSASQGMGGMN
jgi:hypothetical protein